MLNTKALPVLGYLALCEMLGIDARLTEWRKLVGFNEDAFDALFLSSFQRFAESVQLAPASEAHHHAGPGGLLIHTHDVISIALATRRGLQLPLGESTEVINEKRNLWTYAVFAGCLLHDTGKLLSSIRIILHMPKRTPRWWNPHDEPLVPLAARLKVTHYTIEFVKTPYAYHTQVAPTLLDVLPHTGRSWLANELPVFRELCAHLRGDRYESGVIGQLSEEADRRSVAKNLQIPIPTQRFSQTMPLIERYLGFIRTGITDGDMPLNRNGALGYVDSEGYAYFVCRSLADRLIAKCDDLGITDTPRDQLRIYDILQEHGYALPTPEGKAIWTVKIEGQDKDGTSFKHTFTCLKLEARRLTVPTRPLATFEGSIEIVTAKKAQPAIESGNKTAAKAAQKKQESAHPEEAEEITQTRESAPPSEAAKKPVETGLEPEKKSAEAQEDQETDEKNDASEPEIKPVEAESIPLNDASDLHATPKINRVLAAALAVAKNQETGSKSIDIKNQETAPQDAENNTMETAHAANVHTLAPEAEESEEETSSTRDTVDIIQSEHSESAESTLETEKNKVETGDYVEKMALELAQKREKEHQKTLDRTDWQGLTMDHPRIQHIFLAWLKDGIKTQKIHINHPKASVHIVDDGVFLLSPMVFKQFLITHAIDEKDHVRLSKRFDRLRLCLTTPIGANVFNYWAIGNNRAGKMSGRVVPLHCIFDPGEEVPERNKCLFKNKPLAVENE